MSQSMTIIKLFFALNIILISSLPCQASSSSSLIMKLTHRDNLNSPLYEPDISVFNRFIKNAEISRSRASYFRQIKEIESAKSAKTESFRLPLTYNEPLFTVELTFGTPPVKRTLIFDTGSGLTWTQCKPCLMCFKQEQPLFDTKKSKSFKLLKTSDKLARKNFICLFNGCYYYVIYYSLQFSSGFASVENFHFNTNRGTSESFPLAFGCGAFSQGKFGSTNKVSGIFGMDRQPVSFARQLGDVIKHRFSYCLPTVNDAHAKETYLRFGDDAVIRRSYKAQRTPFFNASRELFYQLNLIDLSVDRKRLELPLNTFATGCVIDSGSSVSLLNNRAFVSLIKSIDDYFSSSKDVRRYKGREIPKGLVCYTKPDGFLKLPSMTFHFEGANFYVPPNNLFLVENKFFCLTIVGSRDTTILGAYQQQNVRVVYDLQENVLSFAPEDCSRDA